MSKTERIMEAVRKVMVKNSSVFGLDTYIEIAFEYVHTYKAVHQPQEVKQ